MPSFDQFFAQALGSPPYGYQARIAQDGLPAVVAAPTSAGKTGVILAWLWRLLYGAPPGTVPRRLIYALPQRSLVEQVAGEVEGWLAALGLSDEVGLHVVMGGAGESQRHWRLDMHRPAVVVGTVDSLVSKALNRGYGLSRAMYPIDFALVTNGAHWIIDEIQLCPESTTTLRQLAAFADPTRPEAWPTAEPFGLTCMSATISARLLDTIDNPAPGHGDVVRVEAADRVGELALRLDSTRVVRRMPVEPGDYRALAATVRQRHRAGTLTLVVMNTVAAAQAVLAALDRDGQPEAMLLHSRFRGLEREELLKQVLDEVGAEGRIVVATQVIEAGIDLNAAVMVVEAATWPSVVQRAGRCNRTGRVVDAELWWLPPAKPVPYEATDVEASVAELTVLEGVGITGEGLLARQVAVTEPEVSVLRRPDLLALFDTASDLSGGDVDVAPYVRDAEDSDAQVAWAQWTPVDSSGRPSSGVRMPEQRWRCRVPVGDLRTLAKRAAVWRFDQLTGGWTQVTQRFPARPGELLLVAARDGGYDPRTGLSVTSSHPVSPAPVADPAPQQTRSDGVPAVDGKDTFGRDDTSVGQAQWLSLEQHSIDVREQAAALVAALRLTLATSATRAAVVAGYAHDAGKCYPGWQDALCCLAGVPEPAWVTAGRPWAKAGVEGRLRFSDGVMFRHELVSLLLLDGPLVGLLDGVEDPDLVRYLVLAHHGKLRLQVRGPADTDDKTLLGLAEGELVTVPAMLGQPAGDLTVELGMFSFGTDRSWLRTTLGLRDRYGPFVLAYLETLVRIADWRASAGLPEAR
ncbi:CRISPR-associated helicase Cas3' [Dactylosporangium sp. NPDC051485]|uniref:type I-G CRISPR-associated helicase/endonuclease Cas3g n=1 Tax=Dactylosporangium sp. NPDC051485 TaxID=3154846 RepID=UPI0034157971